MKLSIDKRMAILIELKRNEPVQQDASNSFLQELGISLKEENSTSNRRKWAERIVEKKIAVMSLMNLLQCEAPIPIRFTWLIGDLCEIAPAMVAPAIPHFYAVRNTILFPNFDRSLAKMYWLCGIPLEMEGTIIDELFQWLMDPRISVSTKSYALSALFDFTQQQPDLKSELRLVLEDQLHKNSVSFEKHALKLLKRWNG